MSRSQIALLGAIAGLTIFLRLPVGRLRNPVRRRKASQAREPVEAGLLDEDRGTALTSGAVMAAGLSLGMAGLAHFGKARASRRARARKVSVAPDPAPAT